MSEKLYHCPNPGGYLRDLETGELRPLPCGKWTCPYCGPRKKAKLLDEIGFGGEVIQTKGRRWRFLTLTLSTKVDGRQIDLYFARFRAILHKHGYRPVYFKIKEFTEKGQRHLHILIDVFIPFNFLQYAWKTATEGSSFWVHIKKAQVRRAAGYMAKYLTKQTVFSHQFDKGEHRYSFSRHFPRVHVVRDPAADPGRYLFVSKVERMYELIDAGLWYELDQPPNSSPGPSGWF